jgi:hypothetical protein
MQRICLIAGASLLVLTSLVGQMLAAGAPKKAPPKKPAPAPHKAQKPAAKPKQSHAPKPHKPPHKAVPKVAAKAKPLVKPATHHATGPAHKQQAKQQAAANKTQNNKPVSTQANKDRKPVNGLVTHSVKTSHGWHEFRSHHFAEFHKERGEYSFHSHWWHSFVTNSGTGWSSDSSGSGDGPPDDPAEVTPTVANLPPPPVIRINQGLPISKEGRALAAALDGMDIENHWLAGRKVDWKTGNPVGDDDIGTTSNGGAFVAAVGARFKVPMPVTETSSFLPENQFEWLLVDGKPKGWLPMGEVEAQLLANQGWVVVAAWKNPAPAGERHVSCILAIVHPDTKPVGEVASSGPTVMLAGDQNFQRVALNKAFPSSAWENREVVFLAHRSAKTN